MPARHAREREIACECVGVRRADTERSALLSVLVLLTGAVHVKSVRPICLKNCLVSHPMICHKQLCKAKDRRLRERGLGESFVEHVNRKKKLYIILEDNSTFPS